MTACLRWFFGISNGYGSVLGSLQEMSAVSTSRYSSFVYAFYCSLILFTMFCRLPNF